MRHVLELFANLFSWISNYCACPTKESLNDYLKDSAFRSKYRQILGFVNSSEIVSTDFYSSQFASVIDAQATIVNGKHVTLYCWYDNEYGYSQQVLNLTKKIASIDLPLLPLSIQ